MSQKRNTISELVKAAKDVFTFDFAEKSTEEERKRICLGCSERKDFLNAEIGRCGICGCLLDAKIKLTHSTCPKGLW